MSERLRDIANQLEKKQGSLEPGDATILEIASILQQILLHIDRGGGAGHAEEL